MIRKAFLLGSALLLLGSSHVMASTQIEVKPQQALDQFLNKNNLLASNHNTRQHHYYFPKRREATGNPVFVFDPKQLKWAAYNSSGRLINTGDASGGRSYCPDIGRSCRTPSGKFTVYREGNANCRSSKYPLGKGGAPMPYCMFFHGGYAIHGSPDVPDHNASHGCIRVKPDAAKWLSEHFIDRGTTVVVHPY